MSIDGLYPNEIASILDTGEGGMEGRKVDGEIKELQLRWEQDLQSALTKSIAKHQARRISLVWNWLTSFAKLVGASTLGGNADMEILAVKKYRTSFALVKSARKMYIVCHFEIRVSIRRSLNIARCSCLTS